MRFNQSDDRNARHSNNLRKAYKITGKIIRNSASLNATPFYRSLLLYKGLMQLEKSAKSKDAFMEGKQLIDDGQSLEKVMQLKKDAARENYNCLRDEQVRKVVRMKAWSDRAGVVPLTRFLNKLIDAYSDMHATARGKEKPPAPLSPPPSHEAKMAHLASVLAIGLGIATFVAAGTPAIAPYAAIGFVASIMYAAVAIDLWKTALDTPAEGFRCRDLPP